MSTWLSHDAHIWSNFVLDVSVKVNFLDEINIYIGELRENQSDLHNVGGVHPMNSRP